MKQKAIFIKEEADNYFKRNKEFYLNEENKYKISKLYKIYAKYMKENMKILEIGCCNGINLNYYNENVGCTVYGIDPSIEAIKMGKEQYPNANLLVGTADELPFNDEYFDMIIFGSSLHWVDRLSLSKTVSEADRVLMDGGFLGISDFDVDIPRKRVYKHCEGVYTYKCDYTKIFTALPHYTLVEKLNKTFDNKETPFIVDTSERFSSNVLYKNHDQAYYFED